MPTLTIKGLPPPLYRRLKTQAATHRRSLNSEIIACLERSLAAGPVEAGSWLQEVRAFRARAAVRPLTQRELSAAKKAGRA
ncbi:MAG: Arc family DNA-binding protein [Gemmatimonadales bacterium]